MIFASFRDQNIDLNLTIGDTTGMDEIKQLRLWKEKV